MTSSIKRDQNKNARIQFLYLNCICSVLGFFILFLFQHQTFAQPVSAAELHRIPYTSTVENELREFFLYLPAGYHSSPDRKWPVLMFLHGNGERGNGREELDWVLVHGPVYEAWVQKRDLPFVIISPQLPMFGMDSIANYIRDRDPASIPKRQDTGVPERTQKDVSPHQMTGTVSTDLFPYVLPIHGWERVEEDLISIVYGVLQKYNTDPDRVYLTGLSYGGFGTWHMAHLYSGIWAAINPIVGWGHPDLMRSIAEAKIPVWVFAGGRDTTVPVKYFYPGLNRLESLGHTDVLFTIHEDMGHDVWRRVYAGEDIYAWLLSHSRK